MVDCQIKWMAEELSKILQGDVREEFLKSLKYNRDHVVDIFTNDVEALMFRYTYETGRISIFTTDCGDANVYITYAKRIAEYMHDDMFKVELANIA